MSKVPISVCIIAKNEEKYIEECLRKLKPYGFEIVVADTGSTDATKEIASRYADKVVDFTWINDFSAARNFCAKQASNNWILALDCDEYIESVDIRILRVLLQQKPKQVGVVRMKNIQLRENDELGLAIFPELLQGWYGLCKHILWIRFQQLHQRQFHVLSGDGSVLE